MTKRFDYHLNGLTACVGENLNVYFRKINRPRCKVILIAYFAAHHGDVWKTTKDLCALKIENFICVLFRHSLFLRLSLLCSRSWTRPRPHKKRHNLSLLSWQPWMTGKSSWILITFILLVFHTSAQRNMQLILRCAQVWLFYGSKSFCKRGPWTSP